MNIKDTKKVILEQFSRELENATGPFPSPDTLEGLADKLASLYRNTKTQDRTIKGKLKSLKNKVRRLKIDLETFQSDYPDAADYVRFTVNESDYPDAADYVRFTVNVKLWGPQEQGETRWAAHLGDNTLPQLLECIEFGFGLAEAQARPPSSRNAAIKMIEGVWTSTCVDIDGLTSNVEFIEFLATELGLHPLSAKAAWVRSLRLKRSGSEDSDFIGFLAAGLLLSRAAARKAWERSAFREKREEQDRDLLGRGFILPKHKVTELVAKYRSRDKTSK